MSRARSLAASALAALAVLLLFCAPARAHGILVVDDDAALSRRTLPPTPVPLPPGPVVLKDHRVEATLTGRVADVTVEQVFHSHADRPLEGTYLFPLPEGAAVARFAMTMGGRMVEGEILEAGRARQIYEDIVRRRRDPGLLEYVGRGLFRARVFPIEPHQDLTIRLVFQQVVAEDAGTLEWRYPLATDRLHATPVESVVVSVKVDSDVDLKAIYSPSHDVAIVREGNRKAHVSYERAGRRQEHDFLLYVGRSPDAVGFSLVTNKAAGEDGTFLAILAPNAQVDEGARAARDVVFVLDTSGSMDEDGKIDQARKALEYGVRTLSDGDRFNVIGFATQVRPFRDGLVPATAETKEAAARWIAELQAAGGTNIEGALQAALAGGSGERLHLVVFITDGRPTIGERDVDRLAKIVEAKSDSPVRVFTFGVGFDLEVRLLDRIAEATRAARDYVMPKEDLELVTSRFFRKVRQPVLTDVKVDLGAGVHDVYPARLPDLFAGEQIVLMGRYATPGDHVVRLLGRLEDREVVYEYEGTLGDAEKAPYLPRLWAHRKVGYLLDEIRLHGENKELVDEVIRLATRHGIVTPYTAGLVVEEGELLGGAPRGVAQERLRAEDLGRRLRPGLAGAGGGEAGGPVPAPSSPPAAEREARDSEELKRLKDAPYEGSDGDVALGLEEARGKVKAVLDKTFLLAPDGRWIDTVWDGKGETTKVEAFSEAWTALIARLEPKLGAKVARYLAVGDRMVVVLDGTVYEVVPAKDAPR